jgi:putative flippase GtrA
MINKFFSKQFLIFLATGGFAALVNFLSRILYNEWMSFSLAVVLAYITGMITAFILAKKFVFKESTQTIKKSVMFFCLVNIIAVAQTWLISMALAYYLLPTLNILQFRFEIAHAAGVIFPVFTSYLGHKYWSFR